MSSEGADWKGALDAALPEASTALPARAVLEGRAGTSEDADTLRSLYEWLKKHAQGPALDVTGDDGTLAVELARSGVEVVVLRDPGAAASVRATLEQTEGETADRVTLAEAPPDDIGSVLLLGSLRDLPGERGVGALAAPETPVCAAVDMDGLAELAEYCRIDEAEMVEGLARVRGRLSPDTPEPGVMRVAAALAAHSRDRLAEEQAGFDADDDRWRRTSAEERALQAERQARDADREAERAAAAEKEAQRAERAALRSQRKWEDIAKEAQRLNTDRLARIQRLTDQVTRERELRASLLERRWWKLGEILGRARRSPRAALRAPAEVLRLLRKG